ncbi:Hint domain-containing protein [Paracoccus niistensis]|uniref:Hint domain-containing protein n=1 Tax=Paracoccus niistensis TaxID=632935 RepID=A0ABV6I4N0_9RHOB
MPYITQLPASFLTLDADAGVADLGYNGVLNDLSGSQPFDSYDVAATEGTTLTRGDAITTVQADGTPVISGTYGGSGTLSTAATTVGLPPLTSLVVQVNPVSGYFVEGDDGNAYFISEEPFDGNNVGVTVTGTLLGEPLTTINLPLSELEQTPLLGDALDDVLASVNNTLNTAIVNVAYDPNGDLVLEDAEVVPCFVAGTLILTEDGERAVESFSVGDGVVTRDDGARLIRWIGSRKVSAAELTRNPRLRPIRVRAGALGENTPSSDLLVSPQHRVLVRSKTAQKMFGTEEVLVAAKQLVLLDGIDIAEDVESVEYFHILFDRHEVVISNGAETESLYTGPEALKSVGKAAREEIFALFPELRDRDYAVPGARVLASGRMGRKLAMRHAQHGKPLVH